MKIQIINDSVITENFSETYPFINKYVLENGDKVSSRNGDNTEIIDFKTTITNPYRRCVGNNNRDINIFFLLAEAIWIFTGQKDVEFLNIFNSRMKMFSDDGKYFNAPYGFRLRHYGVSSFDEIKSPKEETLHHAEQLRQGDDQILQALLELNKNPESRRVVMQIWNADLDLNKNSKDLPCNDLIMWKIRNGKLRTTIANRSNDLHWGLPTNVFQFSFLSEMIANILGIELGSQTHNSQSLHIYADSDIAWKMYENHQLNLNDFPDLYQTYDYNKIDMNFTTVGVQERLAELDYHLNNIVSSLRLGVIMDAEDADLLLNFSQYFYYVYQLLNIYADYKNSNKSDDMKIHSMKEIESSQSLYKNLDITGLALNFFACKITDRTKMSHLKLNKFLGTY